MSAVVKLPAARPRGTMVAVRGFPSGWLLLSLAVGALPACRSTGGAASVDGGAVEVPAAVLPAGMAEQALRDSRARQAAAAPNADLELLAQRFRRMNLVAMGRDPDGGRSINMVKNESPEFRQLARVLRAQLGDEAVDVLGEQLADRGLAALVDEAGTFRVPLAPESFQGDEPGPAVLEILGWTRDLPLLLAHHGLVDAANRSRLSTFSLRTLLRARWNIETGQPPEHGFSDAERIVWLEFRGRWRSWAPVVERRGALEELARLLPGYPLPQALEALAREPGTGRFRIVEEGALGP
jgi:hypothetical protein